MTNTYSPFGKTVKVFVESSDHTYVHGNMTVQDYGPELGRSPYYVYRGKAEESDPIGCITLYFHKHNVFVVIKPGGTKDNNKNIIRIVETSTCWSDDYNKWEFDNGQLVKIIETEHGLNRGTITIKDGKTTHIDYGGRYFGYYTSEQYRDNIIGTKYDISPINLLIDHFDIDISTF